MKVGDLVKMKYEMWWKLRSRKNFVTDIALVLEQEYNAVKVMLPNGLVKLGLVENWKVINESR